MSSAAQLPWWQIIQRIGRVVSIQRRLNCRACVGFLRPLIPGQNKAHGQQPSAPINEADWNLAILSPTDNRVPRVIIPKTNCPAGK